MGQQETENRAFLRSMKTMCCIEPQPVLPIPLPDAD